MDRQHLLRLEQLHGPERIVGAHRVVVADRQDGQVDPLLADQPHVAEQAGVGGVVDLLAVLEVEEEAARVAAVAAVGQHRAVEGERQLDAAEREVEAAAVLLAVDLGQPLLLRATGDLVVGDHRRAGALGDGDGVADVVAVAVRDEDEVGLHLVGRGRRRRVAGEEGVDQETMAVGLDQQAGMAQPLHSGRHRGSSLPGLPPCPDDDSRRRRACPRPGGGEQGAISQFRTRHTFAVAAG